MQNNIRPVPEPSFVRNLWLELALLFVLIIGGALLVGGISYCLGFFFPDYASQPDLLRVTQLYSTFCLIGLPVLVWRRIHQEPYFLYFAPSLFGGRDLLAAIAFVLLIQPCVWLLVYLNGLMPLPEWALTLEHKSELVIQQLLCTDQWYVLLANLVVIAIAPAVCEEMLFRGLLQSLFIKHQMNRHLAVWLVALIFGVVHFQFAGLLARIFLGAVLGYLFLYSRTLWLPILVHALNNAGSVVLYFVTYNLKGVKGVPENEFNAYLFCIALVCFFAFFFMLRKLYIKPLATIAPRSNNL